MKESIVSEKKIRRRTLLSFAVFLAAFAGGIVIWKQIRREPQEGQIPRTLRKGLKANEHLFSGTFDPERLVPTYPRSEAARQVRVNGNIGLRDKVVDTATWRLRVVRAPGDTLVLHLNELRQLPKTEIVFDFKCIEGWSQKTWWGGVRFRDFVNHYHLNAQAALSYAGLRTPDGGYYVGIDMASMLQPQTLLCYEMNGAPLPVDQGFPLRLIIPVKYGIKHLKRIGTLYFSNEPPPDYWAERGYDYYSGH